MYYHSYFADEETKSEELKILPQVPPGQVGVEPRATLTLRHMPFITVLVLSGAKGWGLLKFLLAVGF